MNLLLKKKKVKAIPLIGTQENWRKLLLKLFGYFVGSGVHTGLLVQKFVKLTSINNVFSNYGACLCQ